ncbi:ferredoxin reductase [Wenzhouxiangella marina]|uniref:Uncharacterized protein n=1 Tax=Wenzhouxiangella marina TaxID=1579979 RepID=A0A0K0XV91_9GAMM|nr:ferredoxin reductase [Wenzhouxiangella marina]AKS41585.1 hypothetical protein WM2015_1211 [Wenzhouxiangella marina]MBB6086656.1 ferredoxin-NADP reductase [Wenzhouxiangella marina]
MQHKPTSERLIRSPWLRELARPLGDRNAWDRALAAVNPLWSASTCRARIVRRIEETEDHFSLWLQPNRHWRGHRAGQHISLGVEIDGVRQRRPFSISGARALGRLIRVTIQRRPGDGVTAWLHDRASVGQIVELGQANGEFVLPARSHRRILMIAGGTGITPLIAMLQTLAETGDEREIKLLQLIRRRDQRLFAEELDRLTRRLPRLSIQLHCSEEHGRLDPRSIIEDTPSPSEWQTLLCGPDALMRDVEASWAEHGLSEQLSLECFGLRRSSQGDAGPSQVSAAGSNRVFTQQPNQTLMDAAEQAGLKPPSGCRAGVCRSCLCRKTSGRIRNQVTGQVSSGDEEWIQLCICSAESDVALDL